MATGVCLVELGFEQADHVVGGAVCLQRGHEGHSVTLLSEDLARWRVDAHPVSSGDLCVSCRLIAR